MGKIKLGLLAFGFSALGLFATPQVEAAFTPLSFGIAPPIQFPPEDFSVTGIRASLLWGQHRDLYGIDVGLLGNITEQDFVGIGVSGGFNLTRGATYALGLQLAGIGNFNTNKTSVYGLQAAIFTNYNAAESSIYGVQLSLANVSAYTHIYGLQAGIYNRARTVRGFQIGLINVADNLYGVQIGLMNFNGGGPFKVSPFLNIGF